MRFPILGTGESIPLDIITPHEEQALKNHGQTLKRLAERGGLDWIEALCVLKDKDFLRIEQMTAKQKVIKIVTDFNKKHIESNNGEMKTR